MTENHDLRDEIMDVIKECNLIDKEYFDSEEFSKKMATHTRKTVKETVAALWRYQAPSIAIIASLVVYIFLNSQERQDNEISLLTQNVTEIVTILAKLEERTK